MHAWCSWYLSHQISLPINREAINGAEDFSCATYYSGPRQLICKPSDNEEYLRTQDEHIIIDIKVPLHYLLRRPTNKRRHS